MDAFKSKMQAQSDEFIRDIFELVFWPVINEKILPLIDKVTGDALQGLSPKDKVTVSKLLVKLTSIHERILERLFAP